MTAVTPESLRELAGQVREMRKAVRELAEQPGKPGDVILGSLAHEAAFFCAWAMMAANRLEEGAARHADQPQARQLPEPQAG
jgi:hypothetical protein